MTPNAFTVCIARGALAAATLLCASLATAQPATPSTPPPTTKAPSVWQLEIHAGHSGVGGAVDGTSALPSTGRIDQNRLIASTLAFGTGASLFNTNQAALGSTTLITPLDTALQQAAARRASDATGGIRLQRQLTPHYAVEISGDYTFARLAFQPSALAGIEATRASYEAAVTDVLARSPTSSEVSAVSVVNDTPLARQLSATGALVVNLRQDGALRPYLTAGAGLLVNSGTLPSAALTGHVVFGDETKFVDTDTVTIHFTQAAHSVFYVGGGGITVAASRHLGLRADARVRVFRNSLTTLVDVDPTRLRESGGAPFPSLTAGTVQFNPLGPFNGQPIAGSPVFTGSGLEFQTVVTVGLFVRF